MLSTDDDTIRPRFQDQELYLPRLVVNQFRWLDRIVDGKVFPFMISLVEHLTNDHLTMKPFFPLKFFIQCIKLMLTGILLNRMDLSTKYTADNTELLSMIVS